MSPQFRNNRVGSLVGVPNVVYTFCNNVLFVKVCNDRGNGVSVDRELDFVLAPGEFVLRMECLLVFGESAQGDRWISERRFDGAAAIFVFADDERKDAAFSTLPFGLEGGGNLGDYLN